MEFENSHYADLRNPKSWENIGAAVVCVCCAALAAGLTVGLMSLDPLELEVKRRVGTRDEKRHAEKICPLISRHHRLLVTLLLFNSLANEALPIFLAELVPSYMAVIISVLGVLIVGEIIPSALFTGPNQIVMASRLSGFVYLLMGLLYPIAAPFAWVLDRWLGSHHTFKRYTREELSTLVELQREDFVHHLQRRQPRPPHGVGGGGGAAGGSSSSSAHGHAHHHAREKELLTGGGAGPTAGEREGGGGSGGGGALAQRPITVDEATIVAGVLKCHSKKIRDAMKPMDEVYALAEEDVLDENLLCEIMACGYSRIPIHGPLSRCDIRGFLLVKRLIVLDPEDKRPIKTLPLRQPIVVSPNGSLLELINVFQEGRSHMAIVSPCPEQTRAALRAGRPLEGRLAPIGIITLEDIVEEIIQEEIYDELDWRERKALETLRRVRRRVRRQKQQEQQQAQAQAAGQAGQAGAGQAGAGQGLGSVGVAILPPHESASTSTPGTLSLASSPSGSLTSAGTSPLTNPRLLSSGLFGSNGGGNGNGNGNGNGHASPLRPGYQLAAMRSAGIAGGDVEEGNGGGADTSDPTARLLPGESSQQQQPSGAGAAGSSHRRKKGQGGGQRNGGGGGNYGSMGSSSASIQRQQPGQKKDRRDATHLPV